MSGVGDALAAAGGDAEEFEAALDGLAPSAQGFVRAFAGFKAAFAPVQQAVQQQLFQGLGAQVERLTTTALPTLRSGMVGVAGALNTAARSAGDTLANPVFNGTLAQVFAGTAQATRTLGTAVGPLLQVLASLAVVGMPLVQSFAEWAAGATRSAAAFLTSEQGAATMSAMVERAGQVLAQLGRIGASLGVALGGIFGAASVSGEGLLDTIEQLAARFAAWAQSAEGQQQLSATFDTLGQVATSLLEILPLLGGALGVVASAFSALPPGAQGAVAQVLAFSVAGGALISRLSALSGAVKGIGSTLGFLGGQIGKPDSAFRKAGASAAGFAARTAATTASVVASGTRMAASAVASGARVAATWTMMGLKALLAAAKMAAAWLLGLGPIGLVIAAVAAVVALVVVYWDEIVSAITTAWDWITEATSATWAWMKSALGAALDFIIGLFMKWHPVGIVISHWGQIKAATGRAWSWVKSKVSSLWSSTVGAISKGIARAKAYVSAGWSVVKSATGRAWSSVKSKVSSLLSGTVRFVSSKIQQARAYVLAGWSAIKGATSRAWSAIRSAVTRAIRGAYTKVRSIVSRFKSVGKNIISGVIRGVTGSASRLYSKLKGVAKSALNAAKSALGISSPSSVFADQIGRWIPAGITKGLDQGERALDRRMSAMASGLVDPVAAAAGPREVAVAGATGVDTTGPAVVIERFEATERMSAHDVGEALYGLVTARG
ncbi:hypothetical protein [Nocardiopsis rhodophaea]|uniref:phage tail protein n=1 Tax=Nocardiopsis rhodophaea TaxID=280238 RepID=UPI0031E2ECB1